MEPPAKGRPVIPEPASGINFARNEMTKEEWLRFVAIRSDLWLLSMSFFFATKYAFDQADRFLLRPSLSSYMHIPPILVITHMKLINSMYLVSRKERVC